VSDGAGRSVGAVTVGGSEIDLEAAADRHGLRTVTHRTECGSGDPIGGRWRGVGLVEVLAGIDDESTHAAVESGDGFRICVPVADLIDGILAVERLDEPAEEGALPRLVSPSLSGTRLIKGVGEIEGKRLSPAEDPAAFEELLLEEGPGDDR
jgi:DMSO/TMAO reductase YedYZ molybdopterin-dependent catalytic subunit